MTIIDSVIYFLFLFFQDMDVKKIKYVTRDLSSSFTFSPVKQTASGKCSPVKQNSTGSSDVHTGVRRGNSIFDPNVNIVMPEDITSSDLRNVAEHSGRKIYNASIGTTCHQCRYVLFLLYIVTYIVQFPPYMYRYDFIYL